VSDTPLNGNLKVVLIAAALAGLLGAGGGYAGSQALDTGQAVLTERVDRLEADTEKLSGTVAAIHDNQILICMALDVQCR